MEEQLISFETAKLAKEKGFTTNSTCWTYFKDGNEYSSTVEGGIDGDKITVKIVTQSLLQKWLREEHKMIVEVNFSYEYELWEFECFYPESVGKAVGYYSDMFEFKTYEEALEAGLKQALELI